MPVKYDNMKSVNQIEDANYLQSNFNLSSHVIYLLSMFSLGGYERHIDVSYNECRTVIFAGSIISERHSKTY